MWELWGGGSGRAAAHSLPQQSPASLWQINAFLPSSSQTDEFVSCNKGPLCFFCAEQSKIPLLFVTSALCRILHTPGHGYFSGRQIAIPLALFSAGCTTNNLCLCIHTHLILKVKPHLGTVSLPLLLRFLPSLCSGKHFHFFYKPFTEWQFWAKYWQHVFSLIPVCCNWWTLKLCILEINHLRSLFWHVYKKIFKAFPLLIDIQ